MKTSLAHLPASKQKRIRLITELIREKLSTKVEMIILYGSYARGNFVELDHRCDFGLPTTFMSDYDILVLVPPGSRMDIVNQKLDAVKHIYRHTTGDEATVQFLPMKITTFNYYLAERRYFYTDIKREGVLLYDSGRFKLSRRRKLSYSQVLEQAKEYHGESLKRAESFLYDVYNACNREDYKQASFYLHQAAENCYHTIYLTFTLDKRREHDLEKLIVMTRNFAPDELVPLFPRESEEGKRFFDLLRAAYIQSRYNSKFVVTPADIEALVPLVEQLRDATRLICERQIAHYQELAK